MYNLMTAEDFMKISSEESFDKLLSELDSLVGLVGVKRRAREMIDEACKLMTATVRGGVEASLFLSD